MSADSITSTQQPLPMIADLSTLPAPIFTTARLIIRPMHPQDIPSVTVGKNSPAVAHYMSSAFPIPSTITHATKWVAANLTPPYNHFAITYHSDPLTVLGHIGIKPGQDWKAHVAELGYWLGEPYWGKGLMSEVVEGFVGWLFKERGYGRLSATAIEGNVGSEKCLARAGFVLEGVKRGEVRKAGEVWNLRLWGLLMEDWEKKGEKDGTKQSKEIDV